MILIDPLLSNETAKAALDLYLQHRPAKPVAAVIYTHSHGDHFGGAKGVITAEDARQRQGQGDRARRLHGACGGGECHRRQCDDPARPVPVRQHACPSASAARSIPDWARRWRCGTISLIPPNEVIKQAYETRNIDGVEIEFHLVPGSEAPAEMLMYFPQFKLLNMAEDATHTMHNLYTIRGAEIRDGRLWSRYICGCHRALWRQDRYRDRAASLADVGQCAHRGFSEEAARSLQVHPRPERAAAQPRPDARPRSPSG